MSKLVFVVVMLCCVTANAEEIRLRDGAINVESVMAGDAEITLEGRDFSFDGYAYGRMDSGSCITPCDPGDTVPLGSVWYEFYGPAIWQDEHYNIGVWDGTDYIYLDIEGSIRVPGYHGGNIKTVSTRTKVSGDFYHGFVNEEEITGYAVASATFVRTNLGWVISALSYDIRRR